MKSNKYISINVIFCLTDDENKIEDLGSNFISCFDQEEWLQDYENKPIVYGGSAVGSTSFSSDEIAQKLEQKLREFMEEIKNGI